MIKKTARSTQRFGNISKEIEGFRCGIKARILEDYTLNLWRKYGENPTNPLKK